MRRVLIGAALLAGGFHVFSLPFISRFAASLTGAPDSEEEISIPIEIVVEEDIVQQAPEPEDPPEENPEPAASAERPSAPPLATSAEPVPISEVASADTVAVARAIATENGVAGGQGAVGNSSAIGIVPGSGEPTDIGDLINLPSSSPAEPSPRPREAVEEVSLAARSQPSSRLVSCNPCSVPDYPTTARRAQIEGQPVINAIFDENGRVLEAKIEVSSGDRAFDEAALEEARRNWRFQDPEGVGGQVSVGVTYVIEGSEQYEEAQEAGEVRAVELPVQQQIRSITPDQPSSPAAPPASSPAASPAPNSPVERQDTNADEPPEANNPSQTNDASSEPAEASPPASVSEPNLPAPASPSAPAEAIPSAPLPAPPVSPAPITPPPAPIAPPAPVTPPPAPEPSVAPPPAPIMPSVPSVPSSSSSDE